MDVPPDILPDRVLADDETPSAPTPPKPGLIARLARLALRLVLTLALVLLGLYAAVWAYLFAVGQMGALGLLAFALLVGLLIATVGPWLLVRYGVPLRQAIVGLARWIATLPGALRSRAQQREAQPPGRLAGLGRLLGIRFVWDRTAGVWVTLGLVAASAFAWAFAELLFQVVTGGTVAGTDLRILNLIATLRTPRLDQVMYAITFLASAPTIVAVTAVAVGIALLVRRYADALLLVLAPIAGELFVAVVKLLVARPRPPLSDARIVVDGFSFPSGHATVATTLYGTLAYVLLRGWQRRHEPLRIMLSIGVTLLIFAVGLSRVYLGVHYPSDVLAGWAAGAFWLVLVVIAEHLWLPVRMPDLSASRRAVALAGGLALVALTGVYVVAAYPSLPPPTTSIPAPRMIAADEVQATVVGQLPHITETVFGAPQEPISLVFVGTRAELERAFTDAGWIAAEKPELGNVGRALFDGVAAQPDPTGPVAPSFVADEPNTLAFSQPVGSTFAQRHHVRIWSTGVVTSDGSPVWLGTASFDEGFGLSHETLLPTHHIAPDIDAERDYLVSRLQAGGAVASSSSFQLVPPEFGSNFVGDPFFTLGRAVLLVLA